MRFVRHHQRVPQIWQLLMGYFELEVPLSRAWWTGLERSTWSETRAFYHMLRLFDARPGTDIDQVMTFVQELTTPQTIVDVLEALVQERLLSRRKAIALEEAVLARVDREGRWQ
jgi:hypothetical protein